MLSHCRCMRGRPGNVVNGSVMFSCVIILLPFSLMTCSMACPGRSRAAPGRPTIGGLATVTSNKRNTKRGPAYQETLPLRPLPRSSGGCRCPDSITVRREPRTPTREGRGTREESAPGTGSGGWHGWRLRIRPPVIMLCDSAVSTGRGDLIVPQY